MHNPSKDGDVSGHADHTGPVWFEGIQVVWGDIIPPFTFTGGSFAGLNWTAAGQAIYNNGCTPPDPTAPPATPTPTLPPPPTPTPTDTQPTPTPAEPTETPTGSVGGTTATAPGGGDPTLPTTSTLDGAAAQGGDGWRVILFALAGVLAVALLLTPASAVVRKDDTRR